MDLGDAENAERLVSSVEDRFGQLDFLIVNHARSSLQSLSLLTVEELDRSWAVNARAAVLLVQAFAARYRAEQHVGRVVLFTSGQHHSPMAKELPYAISKGEVHQVTLSLADALADRDITVNTIDPGPTDTGWASPEEYERVAASMPNERWHQPDEIAELVRWLVSAEAANVTGHVIEAESVFRR